jgi:hypothetical protein
MANRIRSFKQEIFTDEKTGTLSGDAFRLFLGIVSHSDDYGVIEYRPLELRVKILPYLEGVSKEIVGGLLLELTDRNLVKPFRFAGREYLFVVNFSKHQRVDKPGAPLLDGWKRGDTPEIFVARVTGCQTGAELSGGVANVREDSRTVENVRDDSIWKGKERIAEERKGADGIGDPRECSRGFDSDTFLQKLREVWPRPDFGHASEVAAMEALEDEMREAGHSVSLAAEKIIGRIGQVGQIVRQWPRDELSKLPGLTTLLRTRRYRQDDVFWQRIDPKRAKADERADAIKRLCEEVS